ncbi:MAG TPA: hypothetical protein VH370_09010, partial [Humisphaera sp.]|nr:hypothetical protein [Humisphaera sp.]
GLCSGPRRRQRRRMRQHVRDKPKAGLSNITHTCKNAASEKPGADRCMFGTVLGTARRIFGVAV